MTYSHLLLYRLAELMLEHEQHILPVDLLFDDEQIGDFVKSIQIDSPYQQMLLEGVLTESVSKEKLYVSFTVEGYFHYVLGEVLWYLSFNKTTQYFIDLLKCNATKGLKEGVIQFLDRQVFVGDLNLLLYFIDHIENPAEICSIPLSNAFLLNNNHDLNKNKYQNKKIETLLKQILSNQTESDFNVILEAIFYLERKQKNKCLKDFFDSFSQLKNYESIDFVNTLIKGITYFSNDLKRNFLNKIEIEVLKFENQEIYPEILFEIGTEYIRMYEFELAIKYFQQSLKIFNSRIGNFEDKKEKIYANIGSAHWYMNHKELAENNYNLSHEICIKLYGEKHAITAGSFHNLALIKVLEEKYDESVDLFNKALEIELMDKGEAHSVTARTYSNIGSAYLRMEDLKKAKFCFEKALKIDINILPTSHPNLGLDFDDIGDVQFELGEYKNARENYEKAKYIFIINFGIEYPHVKQLELKISKINDL